MQAGEGGGVGVRSVTQRGGGERGGGGREDKGALTIGH